ncbi:bifunctional protein-serine/threonine kinase/phosphatase [Marinomonas fungiae]|uniref:Serine/threonine protein kinase n=1 Tax=Marinomonas fungiae TaxID=1137284 RepID=A0A0K6IGP3_9GAMM|nr:bifunctional protein-serine/threonine kinase/phosphatase [Marinomonas fungiae]CUB02258.1 Serine/threonine protein kinase [Marinomonas fungiae]
MSSNLSVRIGQCSSAGRKPVNQDCHGAHIPTDNSLQSKGIAIAIADGISSSDVSQFASAAAVQSFLSDYYSTSEAWSVKTSAQRVLTALNAWLYSQTQHSHFAGDMNRGYICTFSALVLKSTTGYVFHSGDSRIYKLYPDRWEQLTKDHRFQVNAQKSYLTRALGMEQQLEFDHRSFSLRQGDVFVLATDGVYEFINHQDVHQAFMDHKEDLNQAAKHLVQRALERGSHDNLSIQLVEVLQLATMDEQEVLGQLTSLPFPPELEARMMFDGYEIVRKIHISPRSHIFIAKDKTSGQKLVLKIPSMALRNNLSYLERFLLEEWIARRLNSAHVLKPITSQRKANYLYTAMEYVDGITLRQWMGDHPTPALEDVRNIIEQIARGLRAFHRHEMLHQDLKPENIMIDQNGTVKIIDFGSVSVAGLSEIDNAIEHFHILGTAQYTAPEYFLGHSPNAAADVFSLGVIAYEMLTGKLPYGVELIKTRTEKQQTRLGAIPINLFEKHPAVPKWVDEAILKAINISPSKRYQEADEFAYDLRHPNKAFLKKTKPPLMARNPVKFWQGLSALLTLCCVLLLYLLSSQ